MHYLLSNDDGYQAKGLRLLANALKALGSVDVIAPDRNQSGSSNSLTTNMPLHANVDDNGFIYVNGTPVDCMHLAISSLLSKPPDIVLSGINAGANLGDDVLYSGTVAAALEARSLGCPVMAVSLTNHDPAYLDTAVKAVLQIIKELDKLPSSSTLLLNINVPDIPFDKIGKFEITRLGCRHKSQPAVRSISPRGQTIYWLGVAGQPKDAGPGTDFHAISNDNVSITPLQIDLTNHGLVGGIKDWANITLNKKGASVIEL